MSTNTILKRLVSGIAAAITLVAAGAVGASGTIIGAAEQSSDLTTLVKAVRAAGLEQTLEGPGPFTVFAPSDAAFANLPQDKLDALLQDPAALAEVLSYHVVPGRLTAQDVGQQTRAKTAQGQSVDIRVGESVTVDSARIVETDIIASNGVVHVIDEVMLPLGYSLSQDYDLMDPDVYLVAPDRLPPNIYNRIYGR